MSFVSKFVDAAFLTLAALDDDKIETMAHDIASLRERGGRLFILGVGGSAANASHAVNDFRKLCNVEAYAPTDNVAELTARTNDDGWDVVFVEWLMVSKLSDKDAILVLSVGGGTRNVSQCIVEAVRYAMQRDAVVLGIVGRDDGFTAKYGHTVVVVPIIEDKWRTPLTEAFQAIIWHAIVNHPALSRP